MTSHLKEWSDPGGINTAELNPGLRSLGARYCTGVCGGIYTPVQRSNATLGRLPLPQFLIFVFLILSTVDVIFHLHFSRLRIAILNRLSAHCVVDDPFSVYSFVRLVHSFIFLFFYFFIFLFIRLLVRGFHFRKGHLFETHGESA